MMQNCQREVVALSLNGTCYKKTDVIFEINTRDLL